MVSKIVVLWILVPELSRVISAGGKAWVRICRPRCLVRSLSRPARPDGFEMTIFRRGSDRHKKMAPFLGPSFKRGERRDVRDSYRRAPLAEKAALVEIRVHRKKRIELICVWPLFLLSGNCTHPTKGLRLRFGLPPRW